MHRGNSHCPVCQHSEQTRGVGRVCVAPACEISLTRAHRVSGDELRGGGDRLPAGHVEVHRGDAAVGTEGCCDASSVLDVAAPEKDAGAGRVGED